MWTEKGKRLNWDCAKCCTALGRYDLNRVDRESREYDAQMLTCAAWLVFDEWERALPRNLLILSSSGFSPRGAGLDGRGLQRAWQRVGNKVLGGKSPLD